MKTIKKYRKKPICISAMQFEIENISEMLNFIGAFPHKYNHDEEIILIHTLEGEHIVRHGDYVIKGAFEEFYAIKPDIFKATYDEVVEDELN